MHTILENLIKQHFGSPEAVAPETMALLQDLEKTLVAQSDVGGMAQSINTIVKHLAGLDTLSEVYAALTTLAQQHFGMHRVQYFIFNLVANNLRLLENAGEKSEVPTAQRAILPMGIGAVGKAAAAKRIVSALPEDLTLESYSQMLADGVQSQAAIPIVTGEDLIGVLDFQHLDPDGLNPDTLLLLELLSIQTGILIDSLRSRTSMLEQFNELSSLQRKSSMDGWREYNESNPLSANRYIFDQARNTAVPFEKTAVSGELQGKALRNPLQVRGSVIGEMGITEDTGQPLTKEERLLIESVSNEVAEALERARLFESSQRSASELAVLNEMGAAFAQAASEEEINEAIFTYATKLMKAPQFFIAYHDPDKDEISFPMVVINDERVTPDHPDHDQWAPRPTGTGLTGYMISNQMPILIDSNAEETLEKLGLPFLKFGGQTQSFLGVPMLIGGRTLGAVSVQCDEIANLYSRHHLNLLTTIASQAAISINNTRLFHSEQERAFQERTVRTITDKVRRGTDTATIMRIALEELSQVLDADLSTIQLGSREQLLSTAVSPQTDDLDKGN